MKRKIQLYDEFERSSCFFLIFFLKNMTALLINMTDFLINLSNFLLCIKFIRKFIWERIKVNEICFLLFLPFLLRIYLFLFLSRINYVIRQMLFKAIFQTILFTSWVKYYARLITRNSGYHDIHLCCELKTTN